MRRKIEDAAKYVRVVRDIAYVQLTRDHVAVIDAADAAEVGKYLWCWDSSGYAVRGIGRRGEFKMIWLHRWLLEPGELEVDHADGDTLNNRRSNLRTCTRSENARNSRKRSTYRGLPTRSRYKGVSSSRSGEYRAIIVAEGERHDLGLFFSPVAAALSYDRAARRLHGEFARTNFETDEDYHERAFWN